MCNFFLSKKIVLSVIEEIEYVMPSLYSKKEKRAREVKFKKPHDTVKNNSWRNRMVM